MENKIVLITPPDKIFNQNRSTLLIYPSKTLKKEAQDILAESKTSQNIYMYEVEDGYEHDVDWLLSVAKFCETVVIDIDNCHKDIKMLASYLVSLPHTYWLTAEDTVCYNKLSPNRIYGLDTIEHLIGGTFEKQLETE